MSTQYARESRKQLYMEKPLISWVLSEKSRRRGGYSVPSLPCLGYLAEVFEYSKDSLVKGLGLIPLYVFLLDDKNKIALCEHKFSRSSGDQPFGCLREATIWRYSSPDLLKTINYVTPILKGIAPQIRDTSYVYEGEKDVFIQVVRIKGDIPQATLDRSTREMNEETLSLLKRYRTSILKAD